ncbi:hypothetical protein ACF07V_22440 [Streptomyces sp. NPDC015661]|uniref:hypothetical protein n=1 Tax=Streptomyces sp. NPDC015661 TaxID=3364961 RepID=UPI0036FBBBCB
MSASADRRRPTTSWREGIAREAEQLAVGALDPGCACMVDLYPDELLTATGTVLGSFDAEVAELDSAKDVQVFAVVERVVVALNAVDDVHSGYETDEREALCAYIDEALSEHGVDVAALTARHGLGRYELTDKWRDR